MKKILTTLAAVLCCAATMPVFTACSVDDNQVTAHAYEQQSDVTVLSYGHGGGSLEE